MCWYVFVLGCVGEEVVLGVVGYFVGCYVLVYYFVFGVVVV